MSTLCWNCRGLGNPRTVREVLDIDAKMKPLFIFLMETKVRRDHAERLKCKLHYDGLFYVDGGGIGGGLALFWRERNSARLLSFSKQHIDIEVHLPGVDPWRLTCFYGYPERSRRQMSWDLLRSLRDSSSLPWLIAGDFNDLASPAEKRGRHSHPATLIEGFTRAIEDCGLVDLGMTGRPFTWERGRGTDDWVEERLDRALAGAEWCALHSYATVYNVEVVSSDHSAIFVDVEKPRVKACRRRFMFENAWLTESGCKDVVCEAWNQTAGDSFPRRLHVCSERLKSWGGDFARQLKLKIMDLQNMLNSLRGRRDGVSLAKIRQIDGELNSVLDQQDIYWKQRAKQFWLCKGDRNTKFFHSYASGRKKKNFIKRLRDDSGMWIEEDGLPGLAMSYFSNIFSTNGFNLEEEMVDFRRKVTTEHNANLLRNFTVDDVREALFSMAPDKSPGPDGFNPGFYQHFWLEIGADVSQFILGCIQQCSMPQGMNDANITLVPKKAVPEGMGDLRPIALCNVAYKILTKMLANRLKDVIGDVVSDSQSAFIPGRLITDNVLVASEVLHFLKRKQRGQCGWGALKLDMAKAYDRMEWGYLREIMRCMGFAEDWIKLVMLCVSSVRYRVVVNGAVSDIIVPTRGLRQGDPLSPYLFILCAEGLSFLLSRCVRNKSLSACSVARGAPGVSHLFFADDSLIFFKATMGEAQMIKSCLLKYEKMSGQSVNFNKSCMVFSRNVGAHEASLVAAELGVLIVDSIGKYLGLPLGVGKNKKEVLGYLETKLKQRIGGWNKRILSRAGKEILLKCVAQALPTYTMSIYHLPITFCSNLEKIMNRFWWETKSSGGGGVHWLSWSRMCVPKKLGGLGFKRLHEFNLALLAKQGWRFLTQPDSLATKIFKARYFADGSFLQAKLGANPSYVWRSIFASQELLQRGCYRRIGNGRTTNIWGEPWLPDKDAPLLVTPRSEFHGLATVSSLIDPETSDWDVPLLNEMFCDRDVELIRKIPVSLSYEDQWCWRDDIRGIYTVKHGYKLNTVGAGVELSPFTSWSRLWKSRFPPKVLNFIWRCARAILPTRTILLGRGVMIDVECPLCHSHPETPLHLFRQCIHTSAFWDNILDVPVPAQDECFEGWLSWIFEIKDAHVILHCVALFWSIWLCRNEVVWNHKQWSPGDVTRLVSRLVDEWNSLGVNGAESIAVAPMQLDHSMLSSNTITIHVDAAVFPDRDDGFVAAVAHEGGSRFVAAMNGSVRCLQNPILAEALAIKEALSWAKNNGWERLVLYSDCQLVCQMLEGSSMIYSYVGCVLRDCLALKRLFVEISFHFVSRSANTLAHALARAAASQSGPRSWFSTIPDCIQHLSSSY